MEVFFDVCPCPILAVTGSDGKTTTTTITGGHVHPGPQQKLQQGLVAHADANYRRAFPLQAAQIVMQCHVGPSLGAFVLVYYTSCKLRLGLDYLEDLDQDVIFRTPGLHSRFLEKARAGGSRITSEI